MTKLDQLLPDLTTLSDEQLLAMVREVRRDRKVNKRAPAKAKKVEAKTKDKAKTELRKLLASMSPEQLEALLK